MNAYAKAAQEKPCIAMQKKEKEKKKRNYSLLVNS